MNNHDESKCFKKYPHLRPEGGKEKGKGKGRGTLGPDIAARAAAVSQGEGEEDEPWETGEDQYVWADGDW